MERLFSNNLQRPPIAGRDRELELLARGLEEARRQRALRTFRILGRAGYGKSKLLDAFVAQARDTGWLVGEARCHPVQHDQASSAAVGLLRSLVLELADKSPRYLGGLETELAAADKGIAALLHREPSPYALAPTQFETLLSSLLDGITLDYPVLIAFDDAQWIDAESARIAEHVLHAKAMAPIALVRVQRSSERGALDDLQPCGDIVLSALEETDARSVVRLYFPDVRQDVADSIVTLAHGVPLDLVTLANQAKLDQVDDPARVAHSLRTVIVKEITAVEPRERALLQCASLMREPIELRLLQRIFPEIDVLGTVLGGVSRRYLVQEETTVRFVHALIAEAVAATVDSALPLQRLILQALLQIDEPTPLEIENIVHHAHLCGETDVERRWLVRGAEEAYRRSSWDIAASKFARALKIRRPAADEHATFYYHYATALQGFDQDIEAEDVIRRAIDDGIALGVKHLGVLAAVLVRNLWDLQKTELAFETYRYYRRLLGDAEDQAELIAIAAHMCADNARHPEYDELAREYQTLDPSGTLHAIERFKHSQSLMLMRRGQFEQAREALQIAGVHAFAEHSLLAYRLPVTECMIDLHETGIASVAERLPEVVRRKRLEIGGFAFAEYFGILPNLVRGAWNAALEQMERADSARLGIIQRSRLLCVPAVIWAFTREKPRQAPQIESAARTLVGNGMKRSSMELVPWLLAATAEGHTGTDALESTVLNWLRYPGGVSTICRFPIALSLYAVRSRNETLMRSLLSEPLVWDDTPWMRAHHLLAHGYLLRITDRKEGGDACHAAASAFAALGAPFLAAFAAMCAGQADPEQSQLLARLGVDVEGRRRKDSARRAEGKLSLLTPREREVAELVIQGLSNREVATALFVSERTVEVHVGNVLAKAGVSSRTQLTRVLLKEASGDPTATSV